MDRPILTRKCYTNPMKPLILASASPRRKEILETLGLSFEVDPSSYVEDLTKDLPPLELTKFLAEQKAKDVATRHPNSLILAADTLVF